MGACLKSVEKAYVLYVPDEGFGLRLDRALGSNRWIAEDLTTVNRQEQ